LTTNPEVSHHRSGRLEVDRAPELPALTSSHGIAAVTGVLFHSSFLAFNYAGGTPPWLWHAISVDNDGKLRTSADGARNSAGFSFLALFHEPNRGEGAAVRTGFEYASGEVIVIQDADMECDPNDWSLMLPLIVDRKGPFLPAAPVGPITCAALLSLAVCRLVRLQTPLLTSSNTYLGAQHTLPAGGPAG
jgi:glycosyltransferase involved in cell wall biosynthesis